MVSSNWLCMNKVWDRNLGGEPLIVIDLLSRDRGMDIDCVVKALPGPFPPKA